MMPSSAGPTRVSQVLATDNLVVATESLSRDRPGAFFDKTYPIPPELTRGKRAVEVRLQARPGNYAGGLYGARILRARP